jgi:IS30 family transposase
LEGWEVVATSTLYSYIHKYTDWWRYLRHKQDGYKNKRRKRTVTEKIKGVEKIDKRDKSADKRERVGDKELDSIHSKNHQ